MSHRRGRLRGRIDVVRGLPIFSRYSAGPGRADRIPIVLVHGLVISSAFLRDAARLLGADHPTYAPDLPGYGRSAKPSQTYGIHEQAEVLGEWMDTIGLGRAVVAGSSMGTQFGTALGVRRPRLVERLVLLGPTMDPAARDRATALLRWLAESPHEIAMLPIALRDYAAAGFRRARETFEMALADRIEERLPQLDMPTLVIRGSEDRIVSQPWAEQVTALLPHGRLEVVDGGYHALNFTSPERFAELVGSFATEEVPVATAVAPPTRDAVPEKVFVR